MADVPVRPGPPGRGRLTIGRWGGVPIALEPSWFLSVILVGLALRLILFPPDRPNPGPVLAWGLALAATVFFFAGILGHELAHAWMARARGIPVEGITLNFLGGAAEIVDDVPGPRDEALISLAGPAVTFALAGVCAVVQRGLEAAAPAMPPGLLEPAAGLAFTAGVLAGLQLWLGAFNAAPCFPLDGGRVLRAILWRTTHSYLRATRYAARLGQALGWLLLLFGVFQFLRGDTLDGWYIPIGWFLQSTAQQGYRQAQVQVALRRIPVRAIMETGFAWAPEGLTLDTVWQQHFAERSAAGLPVIAGGRFAGIVTRGDVRRTPPAAWPATAVAAVMTPLAALQTVDVHATAESALRTLQMAGVRQAPVLENGRVVGLVTAAGIVRLLPTRI